MATKKNPAIEQAPVREKIEGSSQQVDLASMPVIQAQVLGECKECRVENAFHSWRSQKLTPSFNWNIDFTGTVNIPIGKRAVIEFVTATVHVPNGERARLRMYTNLGFAPSNLDLVLTPQGQAGGRETLVATHTVRVYSDRSIHFNVNRDNAQTEGYALICISGYFVDV